MKYMIMMFGSQRDYDLLSGQAEGRVAWSRGLSAPAHARRIQLRDGVPVVTDGPYPETQEVLAGYTVVECASFDRATEIAAQLANTPFPDGTILDHDWYVDVRPTDEPPAELGL
jgi:hypothetical protein